MFNEKGDLAEQRSVTLYPRHWATIDSYAKDEGFSRSLALRKIIEEWLQLKRDLVRQEAS